MQWMISGLLVTAILALHGCGNPCNCGWSNWGGYEYRIEPSHKTPRGIPVDDRDKPLTYDQLRQVDRWSDEMHRALIAEYGSDGQLDKDTIWGAWCYSDVILGPYQCTRLRVTSDYHWSQDGRWQVLSKSVADNELCRDKGLEPTDDCPCRYRQVVQNANDIVIPTPDGSSNGRLTPMLRMALLQVMTKCHKPWSARRLVDVMREQGLTGDW